MIADPSQSGQTDGIRWAGPPVVSLAAQKQASRVRFNLEDPLVWLTPKRENGCEEIPIEKCILIDL